MGVGAADGGLVAGQFEEAGNSPLEIGNADDEVIEIGWNRIVLVRRQDALKRGTS